MRGTGSMRGTRTTSVRGRSTRGTGGDMWYRDGFDRRHRFDGLDGATLGSSFVRRKRNKNKNSSKTEGQNSSGQQSFSRQVRRLGLEDELEQQYISKFEHGIIEPPLHVLCAYADLANISLDCLVRDSLDLPKVISARSELKNSRGSKGKSPSRRRLSRKL